MIPLPLKFDGKVEIFPGKGGWHYVSVPLEITQDTKELEERGLVAVYACVGKTCWNTSLMPKGDGTSFVPIPKKIREAEVIKLGDNIILSFRPRPK